MKDKFLSSDVGLDKPLPLVSIVTVVKNHAEGLIKTVRSIQEQSYSNYEVIIVGGKSEDTKDTTERIAKEFEHLNFRIKYVREIKSGIYPAMNQGLEMTKGEYVWFLNAGDQFSSGTSLESAITEIIRTKAALVIGGYGILVGNKVREFSYSPRVISARKFAYNRRGGCHQAMLFDRNMLIKAGGFETKFQLASDFDVVLKLASNFKVIRFKNILARIEPGGVADLNLQIVFREKHQARLNQIPGCRTWIRSLIWTQLAQVNQYAKRCLRKV